jgi:hypothetical protein
VPKPPGPVPPANQKLTGPRTDAPQNAPIFMRCKTPEFFEKSPLSKAKKHPDFQVTSCLHFVTTNVDFAYIESE